MHEMPQNWIATLLPIAVITVVFALRWRSFNRARKLNADRLWMLPAFYALIVIAIFWSHPPHGRTWLYVALAFLIGLPLGWYRGKLMRINIDPDTHELSQQASPAAMLFIIALILIRQAGRSLAIAGSGEGPDAIFAVTDILLAFALGFLAMQRLEMGLRARTLLARIRGGRAP
jgi:hypothetical protein